MSASPSRSTAIAFLVAGAFITAFSSGLLLAVFAGNLAMKPLTTPILRRFTFRQVLLVNGGLNALFTFACALLGPATPVPVIAVLLFATGLTRSMQFTALNTLAFAEVPGERMSDANTLFNAAQQMAMGMAIAFGATALRLAAAFAGRPSGQLVPADFHLAFVALGVVASLPLLAVLKLDRTAGDEVRRKKAATPAKA